MVTPDNKIKQEITSMWDDSSTSYDTQHGHAVKSDEEAKAWKSVFNKVFPTGKLKILDVGCGTGEISLLLASMGHQVTGLDLSNKMMEKGRIKAKDRGFKINFQLGDAENPPFDDGYFDVVINRHLLWTLPHPQDAVNNWKRVIKPGGRVIIIDGLWDDGSMDTKLRRFVSNVGVMVMEKKNPWKGYYSNELNDALPNAGGTPLERSTGYLNNAGLKEIRSQDITYIRDIQRRYMPWHKRIGHKYGYYLIYGCK
ncbi:class I SAM-dependent methyltransferase [uncultured Methanomethylovorans sp.]|uniref:class I SAM-dependent methyltransferase n=1 Tax=uncultured Methanomethylovorans sp. TaxID=183759 RepID=UPI002AA775F3|nr:class I SAM-dependent methyltransferase [uncultured Methanomethylovorans sp.]